MALLEQGRAAEAAPFLKESARLAPKNAQYWKALGVAFASMNELRDAVEPFRQACALDPRLLDACYYYGRNLYGTDKYEEALAPLEKALAVDPVKGRAEAAIGQCLHALGRNEAAEKRFQSAVARHDRAEQMARLAFGQFLVRQGRAAEAVDVLKPAQRPESHDASYELGLAYCQAGELEEAAAALQGAVRLSPRKAATRLLLAKVYRRLGRVSEAESEELAAVTIGLPEQQ
ncbi:tetratricopeptide repeat protein [Paludibaculum fermentans]|uniref:Tetratricopeptide repeat protein n=1 Tax=Paludibaculum fermentans TaxID=1473598 RepID=A0A7S7NPP2_PALFE|nr:tetratricopeptide repeat protein [Paludibaculum fermentans]QOY87482.1 tetratricopeptide repeat protein [Paludibaculum fermentans]